MKYKLTDIYAENFIPTLIYLTQGWSGMKPGIEVVLISCVFPGGDSLLHVSVCCKLLAVVLLKGSRLITGHEVLTIGTVVLNL